LIKRYLKLLKCSYLKFKIAREDTLINFIVILIAYNFVEP